MPWSMPPSGYGSSNRTPTCPSNASMSPNCAVGQRVVALAGVSRLPRGDPPFQQGAAGVHVALRSCTRRRGGQEIRKTKTGYLSDATQPARIGQIEDAERTAEYRDVLQQEADLIAGHGVQRYIGLIAISARPRTRWTSRSPRSNTLQSKPRVRSAAW